MTELIYPQVDPADWAMMHGLDLESKFKCPNCHQTFRVCVPVLGDEYAGLESTIHNCGPAYSGIQWVPTSDRAKASWGKIMKAFG